MNQRRPIIAAAVVLATLGAGIAATGADARSALTGKTSSTIKVPSTPKNTVKNAALPTTTKPPATLPRPRTKNAALATTTTVKKGNPHATTPPSITTSSKAS